LFAEKTPLVFELLTSWDAETPDLTRRGRLPYPPDPSGEIIERRDKLLETGIERLREKEN
jgi:hypothetical protein